MSDNQKAIIQQNISLKPFNTFGIDVRARYFAVIDTISALQALLSQPDFQAMPKLILGGGSNILFTQDFDGLVIHNAILGIEVIRDTPETIDLKVGAGENWHDFVVYCIDHEYAGIENLSLIPGTVGATPIQNIGAYGVEIKDLIQAVHTISIDDHTAHLFENTDCQFGYRDSIFKNALKNKHIVTHVVFRLTKKPIFNVEYGAIRDKLGNRPLSIKAISDAVIAIRQEKLPDPRVIPNAGSFFKNPVIAHEKFLQLQKEYPHMPHFSDKAGYVKIPAGWLIEQCGFKGKRFDNTGVHAQQALVLVNYGNSTGGEIKVLSEKIQVAVMDQFHIALTTEVNIY
jgi:UDP-N-acetylmuramate dehydrogenase